MSTSIVCTNCGQSLHAGTEQPGQMIACPACGHELLVPSGANPLLVFISYSSQDREIAEQLCAALEEDTINCWMAPRDILPGVDYGEAIVGAISDCHLVVLVFSASANQSPQVKREIERAASKDKPVLTFRIDQAKPTRALEYFISSAQWLDASMAPLEKHLLLLVQTIKAREPAVKVGAREQSRPPAPVELPQRLPVRQAVAEIQSWQDALKRGELQIPAPADNEEQLHQFEAVLTQDLLARNFSEEDCKKTKVALRELLSNLRHLPGPNQGALVRVHYGLDEIIIDVEDQGPGFDLRATLQGLLSRLEAGEREHGLLRALRYGTKLEQARSARSHIITWIRKRRPGSLPSIFDESGKAIPIVFDYGSGLLRVVNDIYTFWEFSRNFRSPAILRIVFEPLRRSLAPFLGFEVRGEHSSITWGSDNVLAMLWQYRQRHLPQKNFIIFADTEFEENEMWRALCEGKLTELYPHAEGPDWLEMNASGAFRFFDIPELCLKFLRNC